MRCGVVGLRSASLTTIVADAAGVVVVEGLQEPRAVLPAGEQHDHLGVGVGQCRRLVGQVVVVGCEPDPLDHDDRLVRQRCLHGVGERPPVGIVDVDDGDALRPGLIGGRRDRSGLQRIARYRPEEQILVGEVVEGQRTGGR
jgi:hypothetical protein